MSDDITIKRVNFDFKVHNEQFAFDLNSNWSSFFRKSFVQIVDDVLKKHNKTNQSIYIDSIDLDLGEIREDLFYEQFPAILRTKIEEAVIKAINSSSNSSKTVITDIETVKYDALIFFLINGYLPWQLAREYRDINLMFKSTLKNRADYFKAFLIKNGHITSLRERLVVQLTDLQLENIVNIVEPTESSFIIGYFRFVLYNYKHIKDSEKRKDNYRNATWHVIIGYLLQNRGTYFNKRDFVKSTIESLSAKYNIKFSVMLRYLSTGITWFSRQYSGITELVQILSDITLYETDIQLGFSDTQRVNRSKDQHKQIRDKAYSSNKERIRDIYKQITGKDYKGEVNILSANIDSNANLNSLISAINTKIYGAENIELSPHNIRDYLIKRDKDDGDTAAKRYQIIRYLLQADSRKRLLNIFTEDELCKLTLFVEPEHGNFIVTYAKTLDKQRAEGFLEGKAGREFSTIKWEFIFISAFQDRGSYFNRKTFAISVINRISAHYNLSFANVIEYIYRGVTSADISTDIVHLIKDIYREWKDKRSDDNHTDNIKQKSLLKAVDVQTTLILFRNSIQGIYTAYDIVTYVREAVITVLLRPIWRREFIAALNNTELKKLTLLVEPDEYEFIIAYSESLDSDDSTTRLQTGTDNVFQQLKWEFIFIAMLEDRGTAFNRKSFILSVLEKISGHYNLVLSKVVEHLYKSIVEINTNAYRDICNILKEINITLKEQRSSATSISDNSINNYRYGNKLYNFIALGYIDSSDNDNIYRIFSYLRTHQPNILNRVLERLRSGFVLSDFITIKSHKQLYRELILYTISAYNLNLPGGKQVQSLFKNIATDRFNTVPITTFKLMFAACIQNRVEWYSIAWNQLTESAHKSATLAPHMFEAISDELLIPFLCCAASNNNYSIIKRYRNTLFNRIFTSERLYRQFAVSLRIHSSLRYMLMEVTNNYMLQLMSDKLHLLNLSKTISETVMIVFMQNRLNNILDATKLTEAICYLITSIQYTDETNAISGFMNIITRYISKQNKTDRWSADIKEILSNSSVTDKTADMLSSFIDTVDSDEIHTDIDEDNLQAIVTDALCCRFGKSRHNNVSDRFIADDKHLTELIYSATEQNNRYLAEITLNDSINNTSLIDWLCNATSEMKRYLINSGATIYYKAFINNIYIVDTLLHRLVKEYKINELPADFTHNMLLHYLFGRYINSSRYNFVTLYISRLFDSLNSNNISIFRDSLIRELKRNNGEAVEYILSVIDKKPKYAELKTSANGNTGDTSLFRSDNDNDIEDGIPIDNAGIVIVASYLPRLYSILELVKNDSFINDEAQKRAAMLTQYIVLGTATFPEHQLVLNKILTGIDISAVLPNGFDITDKEKSTIEQMLKGIIQHWSALKNTSVEGLRESFLKREGIIYRNDKEWHLTVEQKGYDVLIDRLPWSFTTIKSKWMDSTLFVKWR